MSRQGGREHSSAESRVMGGAPEEEDEDEDEEGEEEWLGGGEFV